jgi:hypothetical protein
MQGGMLLALHGYRVLQGGSHLGGIPFLGTVTVGVCLKHVGITDPVMDRLRMSVKTLCVCPSPQAFVVKVEREGQQGSVLVQRSFEEFYELHSKLRLIFPSSKLPR